MTPRLSVLIPTRARTERLHTMLESLVTTADDPRRLELVFRIDEDDVESRAYLTAPTGWVDMVHRAQVVVGEHLNGYASLPTMINEAAEDATAPLLIVINDDVVFRTAGWDRRLCEEAAKYPDGLFNLGVTTVINDDHFVFPCQSKRQVAILGGFFDARLVYTDIWLRDVLQPFERAIRVPDVVIEHQWIGLTEDQVRAVETIVAQPEYWDLYEQCVDEGRSKILAALQARVLS